MVGSTITPAFFSVSLLLLLNIEPSPSHGIIKQSLLSSCPSSAVLYLVNSPISHCPCPAAWLPLRSFYLSCWSLSVGRCPYISIQSLFFPPVFIMAVKTFHPSLSIFESLFCRAQDYFLAVDSSFSPSANRGKHEKKGNGHLSNYFHIQPWKYALIMV